MKQALFIALAGALGALSRYGIGRAVGVRSFPYATIGINVAGSFALGVVLFLSVERLNRELATALAVGFLGAFTTFSTFSHETVVLLRTGRAPAALAYVALSVALGVAAAFAGYEVARAVTR